MNSPTTKNTQINANSSSMGGAAERPKASAKLNKTLMLMPLTFLFALTAMSGSGWLWYQQQIIKANSELQLTQLETSLRALNEHPALIELKQRILEQNTKLAEAINEQTQQIEALKQAFSATQEIVNRDQQGWVLAEIEYLIRLAIIRLRLTRDIYGATEAMVVADQRLADLADPALLEVREILAGEISSLKILAIPDVEGVALQLISLSNQLHLLPQAKRPAVAALEDSSSKPASAVADGWTKFLNRFGIHRSNAPVATAALQANLYYVEQLLHLELESAKRAALELNSEKFDRHLLNSRTLLEEHYDRDHAQVIRIRGEIARLQESDLIPALPDITGSLKKLRELQLKYKPVVQTSVVSQ